MAHPSPGLKNTTFKRQPSRSGPAIFSERGLAVLLVVLLLAGWEFLVRVSDTPAYLIPPPSLILQKLMANLDTLPLAAGVTLLEALGGLLLGSALGLGLAVMLNFWAKLEKGVLSLAMLVKATPLIAIAPILTIWLGFGPAPKIVVTALLTFFPVLINALSGFRAVDPATLELFQSLNASPREIFVHLRWPGAQPFVFAALKVAGPLSLIGAVVAEWMGASSGLGREMWLAYTNLNMPALFAAVFVLAIVSTALFQLILVLERSVIFWNE